MTSMMQQILLHYYLPLYYSQQNGATETSTNVTDDCHQHSTLTAGQQYGKEKVNSRLFSRRHLRA